MRYTARKQNLSLKEHRRHNLCTQLLPSYEAHAAVALAHEVQIVNVDDARTSVFAPVVTLFDDMGCEYSAHLSTMLVRVGTTVGKAYM